MTEARRTKILTHLWYAKEAEEAAKLYTSLFPDSRIDHVTALPSDSPSGPAGSVKVVDFTLFGQRLRAISAGQSWSRQFFFCGMSSGPSGKNMSKTSGRWGWDRFSDAL